MIHVFYHANCTDGFTAAWAAWKALGDSASYVPMMYSRPLPDVPPNSSCFFLDYVPDSQEDLLKLHANGCDVTVIDHHATARDKLEGLPSDITQVFDMEKSGAVLAWEFFHPGKELPLFVKYVQDRDLWTLKLVSTEEVTAYISSLNKDWATWEELNATPASEITKQGAAILRYRQMLVRDVALNHIWMNVGGYHVPVVNIGTEALTSDVCSFLYTKYSTILFAAVFFYCEDGVKWSLRSKDPTGLDVSEIAKKYGGGGHKHSAGFLIHGAIPTGGFGES